MYFVLDIRSLIHPLVGLGGGLGLSVMITFLPNMASSTFNKSMKRTRNDDLDSDSDSELYVTSDTWPRFMVMTSASEEKPLSKLSPFAVQKGFQAIAGTLKGTKKLRDGSFLVECSRRAQAENLMRTTTFVDRPVHV